MEGKIVMFPRLAPVCEWTRSGGLRVLLLVSVFFLMPHCESLYFYVTVVEFLYFDINQRQPG